jgi:hypothetical protein
MVEVDFKNVAADLLARQRLPERPAASLDGVQRIIINRPVRCTINISSTPPPPIRLEK